MTNRSQIVSVFSFVALIAVAFSGVLLYNQVQTGHAFNWNNWFGSSPAATVPTSTVPATSTPVVNTGPKSFSDFDTYTNGPEGWRIFFPHTFTFGTSVDLSAWPLATGTLIAFPSNWYTGTNLREAKIALATSPYKSVSQCFPNTGVGVLPKQVTLGAMSWYMATSSDAGAGNYYETENYVTVAANKCYVVSLLLHSVNRMNYDESNRPSQYDKARYEKVFQDVVSSFQWVQ